MTKSFPKVSVIIPNWNGEKWLSDCLKGLSRQTFVDFDIILVDNGSQDNSMTFVKENYPEVKIISFEKNRGFAVAANIGIQTSCSEYVALLNNDTRPQPHWLFNLVNVLDQCSLDVGCLASKMLDLSNPDLIENAGDTLSWYGAATKRGRGQPAKDFTNLEEIFSPCAGAALYRRSFLEELGGFDECFFAYLEDVDLGLRGQLQGYKCLFVPSAEVLHQGHGSLMPQNRYVRLITKNRLLLFLKNLPFLLLLRHLTTLLYGQWYFFIAYGKPLSSLAGYLSFVPLIPHVLKERWKRRKKIKLSRKCIEHLLQKKMDQPLLRSMIINKVRKIWD